MRYLGIDFGTKRVGLALSDEAGTMGFPHDVLSNDARLVEDIGARIAKEQVGAIVIGASFDLSGRENRVQEAVRAFAKELQEHTGMPIFFESEWLTTQEAQRDIEGARGRKQEGNDAAAAALILTSYLSKTQHHDND